MGGQSCWTEERTEAHPLTTHAVSSRNPELKTSVVRRAALFEQSFIRVDERWLLSSGLEPPESCNAQKTFKHSLIHIAHLIVLTADRTGDDDEDNSIGALELRLYNMVGHQFLTRCLNILL